MPFRKPMNQQIYQRIRENPHFDTLVKARSQLSWTLVAVVLILFYGLILVVAFNPSLMGQRLAEGSVVTLGVILILAMFILFWILTAFYVRRANTEFDDLTQKIVDDAIRGDRS
ncbi:MAG: DUF485 domain-containing protein [Leptothrix ochracea]